MSTVVLHPRFDHPALEERYAHWQSRMLLQKQAARVATWERGATAAEALQGVTETHVLVVTDPLLLPAPALVSKLEQALGGAFAAVPGANSGSDPRQQVQLRPYMTLREFEQASAELQGGHVPARWENHDPGAFLSAVTSLRDLQVPLERALDGRDVVIDRGALVHRWASLRGQVRHDLLDRISPQAESVLEFGCGEAPLGAALKNRQPCRVVGIEIDPQAAAIARTRIDEVHCGDARSIAAELDETFDCIVGGDIVEHLDEPWSFLAALRRVCRPGGRLLLSLPNIANGSIVSDLLQGRFDYVYMGLTCVGHLRFFTRRSLEEMLTIAGWEAVSIEPQSLAVPPEHARLLEALRAAGIPFDPDEVAPSGFYVNARNPG